MSSMGSLVRKLLEAPHCRGDRRQLSWGAGPIPQPSPPVTVDAFPAGERAPNDPAKGKVQGQLPGPQGNRNPSLPPLPAQDQPMPVYQSTGSPSASSSESSHHRQSCKYCHQGGLLPHKCPLPARHGPCWAIQHQASKMLSMSHTSPILQKRKWSLREAK